MSKTAWGGRFEEELADVAQRVNTSVDVDKRLAPWDIRGSLAHAQMLSENGIISSTDFQLIRDGLLAIEDDIALGKMDWRSDREDVHMNIEALLTERIGEAGGRLHTARSRNDQVATDMRLFCRDACMLSEQKIHNLVRTLVRVAEEQISVLMPGYTHLQRAQPIRLSHHLLAWCEMLWRDRGRIHDARVRLNESPLGSAALAGTTFPIDRVRTAELLGFARPMRNSLDATASRDFLLEVLSSLSIAAITLSRIAEELVLWSTQEFAFIEMSDAFTTGSSIMPQKKNPDMAELVRGKTGRVVGDLVSLIVTVKGLPLAYNRDLQEDKRPVFDAFDTVNDCLDVLAGAIGTAHWNAASMRRALAHGFVDATEVADWLAARGVPFREAHHVSGRLVKRALDLKKTLPELALVDFQQEHALFDNTIFAALDPETAIERRNVIGGPARAQVMSVVVEWQRALAAEAAQTPAG